MRSASPPHLDWFATSVVAAIDRSRRATGSHLSAVVSAAGPSCRPEELRRPCTDQGLDHRRRQRRDPELEKRYHPAALPYPRQASGLDRRRLGRNRQRRRQSRPSSPTPRPSPFHRCLTREPWPSAPPPSGDPREHGQPGDVPPPGRLRRRYAEGMGGWTWTPPRRDALLSARAAPPAVFLDHAAGPLRSSAR